MKPFKRPKTEGEYCTLLAYVLTGILIFLIFIGLPIWIDIYELYFK